MDDDRILGRVISGSYSRGIKALLNSDVEVEDFPIGGLVIVESKNGCYLCMINDIEYSSNELSESIFQLPNEYIDSIIRSIGKDIYKIYVNLIPIAKYCKRDHSVEKPDTIPKYGSVLIPAKSEYLNIFYGSSDWRQRYPLGSPKIVGEYGVDIPIDIRSLIELNFGIYGKSGSGKTFIANLLIGYSILYSLYNEDSIKLKFLIFDMHDEYSLYVLDNMRNKIAKGVANIFRDLFRIFTPDIDNVNRYNMEYFPIPLYDVPFRYAYEIVKVFDPTQSFLDNFKVIHDLLRKASEESFGSTAYWFLGLITSDETLERVKNLIESDANFIDSKIDANNLDRFKSRVEAYISSNRALAETFRAGRRRLIKLLDLPISFKECYSRLLDNLINELTSEYGANIAISMGRYEKYPELYMIIANLIAFKLIEKMRSISMEEVDSRFKIIIMLEEAHKFLGKGLSSLSPFGVIAREMRKRGVVIVPIDQKPSELDPDVTSMIWTSIVFALTDSKDIDASLAGLDNPSLYKNIISSLRPGEALIYGPAVKFPVVLKIKNYKDVSKEFENKYKQYKLGRDYGDDLTGDII